MAEGTRDLMEGPVWRGLAAVSAPMMLGILAVISTGHVDAYFLARVSPEALAAVGFVFPVTTVISSLSIGLSAGASGAIGRRGEGRRDPSGPPCAGSRVRIGGAGGARPSARRPPASGRAPRGGGGARGGAALHAPLGALLSVPRVDGAPERGVPCPRPGDSAHHRGGRKRGGRAGWWIRGGHAGEIACRGAPPGAVGRHRPGGGPKLGRGTAGPCPRGARALPLGVAGIPARRGAAARRIRKAGRHGLRRGRPDFRRRELLRWPARPAVSRLRNRPRPTAPRPAPAGRRRRA